MSARSKAYIFLIITVAIWGFAGPIIKYTLGFFDPITFLTYRFFLSSLFLIPILFVLEPHAWHKLTNFTSHDWFLFIICGLTGTTLQLLLLFKGFELTSSVDGTLINSSSPILSALIGFWFLKEHITRREKVGLTIAFLGSIIVLIEPLLTTGQLFSGNSLGNLLILLANFVWAIYVVLSKRLLRHNLSPLLVTTSNFFIGFLSMSAILLLTSSPSRLTTVIHQLPLTGHLSVAYMALLSGALAYFLYQKAQKSIETSEANVFIYLQPLFATPLAFFWLGEPITLPFVISAIVLAAGVYIAETKASTTS